MEIKEMYVRNKKKKGVNYLLVTPIYNLGSGKGLDLKLR